MSGARVLLVEDDPYARVLRVILDPHAPDDLRAAFAQMISHEIPDFGGWCSQVRIEASSLFPCEVRMVASRDELRVQLADADAVMVESLQIGADELARAPKLKVVQKYGAVLDNIDRGACAARGIAVRVLHRRANASVAEHALAMMLMLARRLHKLDGLISADQLRAAGFAPAVGAAAYEKRVPGSGWARVTAICMLMKGLGSRVSTGASEPATRMAPAVFTERSG